MLGLSSTAEIDVRESGTEQRGRHAPRFAVSAVVYTASQVFVLGTTFLWTLLLANGLGATGYGKYAVVSSYVAQFIVFLDFGFELVILRDVAAAPARGTSYWVAGLLVRLLLSLVCGLSSFYLTRVIGYSQEITYFVVLYFLGSAASSVTSLNLNFLQAASRFTTIAWFASARAVATLALGWLVLRCGGGIIEVLIAWCGLQAASAALSGIMFFSVFGRPSWHAPWRLGWALARQAAPLGLAAVFSVLLSRLDKVMLSRMVAIEAVGWYNAAFLLVMGVVEIGWSSFQKLIYPRLSEIGEDDTTCASLTQVLVRLFAVASCFCCLGVSLFAPQLRSLLFPRSDMAPIAASLQVLVWSVPFTVSWCLYRNVQLIRHRHGTYARATAICVVVYVPLVIGLVRWMGWLGASWAYVAVQFLMLVLTLSDLRHDWHRLAPIRAMVSLIGVIFAVYGVHVLGRWLAPGQPALSASVCLGVYCLGVLSARLVGAKDLEFANALLDRPPVREFVARGDCG